MRKEFWYLLLVIIILMGFSIVCPPLFRDFKEDCDANQIKDFSLAELFQCKKRKEMMKAIMESNK